MICTLGDWQIMQKPNDEILYNCSEFDKQNDEWVSFPIGMGFKYIDCTDIERSQIGIHSQLVLCAVADYTDGRRRGATSKNRRTILQTLASNGISNSYVDASSYFFELPKYKFVISL